MSVNASAAKGQTARHGKRSPVLWVGITRPFLLMGKVERRSHRGKRYFTTDPPALRYGEENHEGRSAPLFAFNPNPTAMGYHHMLGNR
jgi:hypothetical protein